ncbi:hypothetical protein GCM10011581_43390 [Saccharopolyspora subtropica]|uniref:C2H2-type domain-containing protein n=1 Tax=Saccharopolyspora thermophila TaxID=89367 RepID=A0A917K754_9PSEU|nr:hypothetical protein [Saccharopolyspora subtropica]GGJ01502.1 hypothetical protein GCM10011581_43390 [Saccharopolyspora subtropica]
MTGYDWRLAPLHSKAAEHADQIEVHKLGGWKPHMARRPGETVAEWHARLVWSCYVCGQRFERGQRQELNDHEDAHGGLNRK